MRGTGISCSPGSWRPTVLPISTYSLMARHIQKDIWPTRADIRAIPRSILDHLKLKHPTGDAARRYNVLQKLAYLGVILLICLMVLTGLDHVAGH